MEWETAAVVPEVVAMGKAAVDLVMGMLARVAVE